MARPFSLLVVIALTATHGHRLIPRGRPCQMLAGGAVRGAASAKPRGKQAQRPTLSGDEPRWGHKKLRPNGVGSDEHDGRSGGSGGLRGGGRSRSAKREAFYSKLSLYSGHFSVLLKSEFEAEQEALRAEICEWPIEKLKQAGLLLDGLRVRHVEELYDSPVLRLSLRPPPPGPRSERATGSAPPAAPPLPYHTFAVGDAVSLCCGSAPVLPGGPGRDDDEEEGEAPVPGVVLQRTDGNLLVVVPRMPPDQLEELRKSEVLCLYRGASAVPYERSQRALDALCDPELAAEAMHLDLRDLIVCQAALAAAPPPTPLSPGRRAAPKPAPAAELSQEALAATRGRPSYLSAATAKSQVRAALASVAAASALNPSQLGAISSALQRRLTLIQGPPGTGKTRTACHLLATCALLRRAEGSATPKSGEASPRCRRAGAGVLAVAASNVAADELLRGLRALGVDALRLGQAAGVAEPLRNSTLEAGLAREEAVGQARAGLSAAQGSRNAARVAAAFAEVQRVEAVSSRRLLMRAPVVVATCIGAGKLVELLAPPASAAGAGVVSHFGSVLVDEAAQVVEPAGLVAALLGCEQLILVGDPCQLPPTVVDRDASRGGLATTLFDRLMAAGVAPLLLDTQYRMHPAIAEFPSRTFYGGKLKSAVQPADRPAAAGFSWPDRDRPVAFLSLAGTERREAAGEGGSFSNQREAARVAQIVRGLLEAGEPAAGIGVISPYSAQVRLIQAAVARLPAPLKPRAVQVSSVDGFQGCERELILISTVRSNPERQLGFLSDFRRLNVAVTRARRGLVIVGDAETLRADATWRKYLQWLRADGLLVLDDEPPAAAAAGAAAASSG